MELDINGIECEIHWERLNEIPREVGRVIQEKNVVKIERISNLMNKQVELTKKVQIMQFDEISRTHCHSNHQSLFQTSPKINWVPVKSLTMAGKKREMEFTQYTGEELDG